MKKSTKLLSVLLAVLMIFSTMSVMASAYTKEYKTHEAIEALNGYNDIDTVTRLSVDVRADMILDWLDELLAGLNLNMDLSILGTLNATSIDNALNSIVEIVGGSTFGFAGGIGLLGDLKNLNINAVKTYRRSSESTGSEYVLYSLIELLGNSDNVGIIKKVVDGSINFGKIVGQLVGPYKKYINDIPGLLSGMIAPMFERKDDTMDEINAITAHSDMDSLVKNFVIGLFSKPQSTTTYKEDAAGNVVSNHTLPGEGSNLRTYYVKNGDSFTCYVYNTAASKYEAEAGTFDKKAEVDGEGKATGYYTYEKATGESLKYYKNGSYWLPTLAASGRASTIMDITANTPAQMLYDMIPYVFEALAPVVLNGSVKKLLGEWLGASYNYIGEVGSAAVKALPDASDIFFTQPQGDYAWEWSDYKVIGDNHYYRFEDQIYKADLSNINEFFTLVNFDYKITGDYLNEFIPASSTSNANTLLSQVNNLIAKAFGDCVNADVLGFTWEAGDNSKIIPNIRSAFTAILNLDKNSGDRIFQDLYDEDLVAIVKDGSGASNQKVVAVLLAFLAKSLMPQVVLPAYADINSMLEVGAVVVRELATQLIPGNDFDDLIYANYTTTTLKSHTDAEWLDIILTMGSQIGVFYLNNIADLALTDPALGGFVAKKTWHAADLTISGIPAWEATVDFIADWALEDDNGATGAWKMRNLVNTSGLTIDRNSVQDPWQKLDTILSSLLPVNEILNVTPTAEYPTVLEQALRGNFVDAILALDVNKLVGMFAIPNNSCLRTMNLESALFYVVRKLINDIARFGDPAKGDLISDAYTNINYLLTKANLATLVGNLLPRLSECRVALINTVLPFLNWLIGWSTNDQFFKAATVSAPRYSYNSAAVGTLNDTITVKNNANGMERQYTNTDGTKGYNSNYEIEIDHATASVEGVTIDVPAGKIPAGQSVQLTISGSFTVAQPVIYRVYYRVYSAEENRYSENLYVANAYSYLALTDSDENLRKDASSNMDITRDAHALYVFTKDVHASVSSFSTSFQHYNIAGDATLQSVTTDTAPVGEAANYFRHATLAEVKAEMSKLDQCSAILSIAKMGAPGSASLYRVKDGVESDDIPYGIYDMGQFALKFKRGLTQKSVTDGVIFVYYTDYGLEDLAKEVTSAGITIDRIDYSKAGAQAAWDEYVAAVTEAVRLIKMPYVAATMVTEWMPQAEAAVARLKAAYENIQKYFHGADVSRLTSALADTSGINFQNVEFYRYTKYEKALRSANSMIDGQTAPTAPEKFIRNEGLNAKAIDALLAAEADAFTRGLIENTVEQPPQADTDAYIEALSKWTPAPLFDYEVAIATENLRLSHAHILTKATDKTFLAREIATADARNFNESLYTAESYEAFANALASAKTVNNNANATQQEAFDAKYALLVAENKLLLKTDSCRVQGVYSDLDALIQTAEVMLKNTGLYKLANGSEDAAELKDAWTNLLKALGYDYTNADNEPAILYGGSAKAFVNSDRRMTATAQWRAEGKYNDLKAAMDAFTCAIQLVPDDAANPDKDTAVSQFAKVIDGINPGSVNTADELLALLTVSLPEGYTATMNPAPSSTGYFGTGATVELAVEGVGVVAVYNVVIYGDVNGDGAIDVFDASVVDQNVNGVYELSGAYKDAALVASSDEVALADYTAIFSASVGAQEIAQTRA